jgi:hypothetical protein
VVRASLWSGTTGSWVDLNPIGSTLSIALAVSGGQQAGYADVGVRRASLWSGTAASWVDLSPAGSTESVVYAASGGQQVGSAFVNGVQRASLWSGTPASWVDLSAFLPAGFGESYAQGISSDGVNTYISGYGYNLLSGRNEALLWTRPIPGACCNRWTGHCVVDTPANCAARGLRFDGVGVTCSPTSCKACPTDFNGLDDVTVQDIFDFLAAWNAGCP